tara:strand:+ start:681 stop:1022 length:342 start_codon:yes stop_codon:yes gene_type:complete
MANTLKNLLHTQLSTDSATLYTCPSNTKTIVIGMSAANILSNQNANFSTGIQDSSGAAAKVTHIVKNTTVAPGGTEVVVGGDHKIIMQAGNILKAVSSDSDSLDIIVSFVEQT